MDYWIVPSNDSIFRIADAIKANKGVVDWRQSNNFAVGDVVFIYKGLPEQRVIFRMEVLRVNIPEDEALEQEAFWTDQMAYIDGLGRSIYVRFGLVETYEDDIMSLHHLHEHGFKGNIQGVQHCPDEAIDYMLDPYGEVNSDVYDVDYPAEDEKLYEGALIRVMANKYERNRDARDKCIKLKGAKCQVCGRDFEETYGEIGKDFIHVHHLVPISSIGKEYELDIDKDLAPVCPNCHYMLHRQDPPLTIEDLKKKMYGAEEAKGKEHHITTKLETVDDDQEVRLFIFRLLHMDSDINDLRIQKMVIERFGERYPDMSLSDWYHIIYDYTSMVREAMNSKPMEVVIRARPAADPPSPPKKD